MVPIRIAGTGIVSCHGSGHRPLTEALRVGRDGRQPLSLFSLPGQSLPPVNQIDRTPFGHGKAAILAIMRRTINDALREANLGAEALEDCALLVGCSSFLFVSEMEFRYQYGQDPVHAERRPASSGDLPNHLAAELGIRGPVFTVHTACSSSANAMLLACDMLARGEVRRALVLGAEGLSAISLSGFSSMLLLDPEGCHPFDANRRGLQLGEGFAAVLLEASQDDNRQGAFILGGENLCDIHHMTSANPDGSSMRHVMHKAVARAGLGPGDITAIKAHGTGSLDNDTAEAAAMRDLFGKRVPPLTVIKRPIGHTLGACGTMETVALLGCLREGFLPATAGFTTPDPALGLQPLTENHGAGPGNYLLNFFGFGGNYASLVMRYA